METRRISFRISRADMATVGKIVERADCFVPRCARPNQTRASVRKRAFRKPTPAPAKRGAR